MEPFEINLDGKILTATLQEDGSYIIHESEKEIGTINPQPTDLGIQWTSTGQLTPDYAKQIGELIEEHDL